MARIYSRLLFASSLLDTAAVACFPAIERRLGRIRTAWLLAVGAAFGSLGFVLRLSSSSATQAVHAALVIAHLACIAVLEPSLKSVASLQAAQAQQGRTFGASESRAPLPHTSVPLPTTKHIPIGSAARTHPLSDAPRATRSPQWRSSAA